MGLSDRVLGLLAAIDRLFESVVMEAGVWDDQAFAEWVEEAVGDGESLDREAVKIVRRAVRRAQRMQRYWDGRADGPEDWRMRVDETLGSAGWRPGLDLAEWGMVADPDPVLFEDMADRFRAVNFAPIGMTYEEWIQE